MINLKIRVNKPVGKPINYWIRWQNDNWDSINFIVFKCFRLERAGSGVRILQQVDQQKPYGYHIEHQ